MNFSLILEIVFSAGLYTSVALGLLVGAFYGYSMITDPRPQFPSALWSIGLAFVVSLGILAALDEETSFSLERNIARGILWTILCFAIPSGRRLRIYFERWRIRRRTKKLQE